MFPSLDQDTTRLQRDRALHPGEFSPLPLFKKGLVLGICLFASVATLACSEDATEPLPAAAPEAATEIPLAQRKWIDSTDATRPEVWLVSRMTRTTVDWNEPALARVAMLLDAASRQFHEPPRMIANRAVQLEGMLAARGGTEQAPDLIELLAQVDGVSAAEGFGAVCQHYYNLRSSGLGQDETIIDLKRRYGARR